MEWKEPDTPVKKMFQALRSVEKVMLTDIWKMKGPIAIDLIEKGCNGKQCFLLPPPKAKFTLFVELAPYLNAVVEDKISVILYLLLRRSFYCFIIFVLTR